MAARDPTPRGRASDALDPSTCESLARRDNRLSRVLAKILAIRNAGLDGSCGPRMRTDRADHAKPRHAVSGASHPPRPEAGPWVDRGSGAGRASGLRAAERGALAPRPGGRHEARLLGPPVARPDLVPRRRRL